MQTMILCLGIVLSLAVPSIQERPDFSGAWVFDANASMKPGPDGRIVLAAMLGDEFVAEQDARAIRFTISTNGQTVKAAYNLDGSESRNVSPGDIEVVSRASWEDGKLVVLSRSQSMVGGEPVTIETKRVMWLDDEGHLILERSGTPASEVTPSRSVYRRRR